MKIIIPEKEIELKRCLDCPYFENTMDGCECWHPKMAKLSPYGNLISCSNVKNGFPDNCPWLSKS